MGEKRVRGVTGCNLPLNLGKNLCFHLAFHSMVTLRASDYAPPDTKAPNLQLVALERLPSIESAEEIQIDVTFSRGPCRGGALLRPPVPISSEERAEQSPAPTGCRAMKEDSPAKRCRPTNLVCTFYFPQIFKRNCSQICCTVSGGAHQDTREVSFVWKDN